MAEKNGISAAGKEYGVKNEVESLRSLSVELYQSKLTVDEAKEGHGVYLAAGSIVGPGREIPNELRLTPMGERTIRKCNPGGNIEGYQVIQKHTGPLD